MNSKVLLVGGSGFIGQRLAARLGPDVAITTYRTHPFPGGVHFDVETMRLGDRFLTGRHGISHAVLMHGMNKLDYCALHPAESAQINVDGMIQAIDDLLDAGVKPLYMSSDGVFDGSRGPWSEDDTPCPILTYGRHKAAIESYLSKISSPWLVARLAKVVGDQIDPRNMLSEWLEAVSRGQVIRCASDQILSPIDVDDVVDALIFFLRSEINGLFNVCGSQILSRHELLQLLLSYSEQLRQAARIELCSLADFTFAEARPKNCSMSNRKFLLASGMNMRPITRACRRICQIYAGQLFAGSG